MENNHISPGHKQDKDKEIIVNIPNNMDLNSTDFPPHKEVLELIISVIEPINFQEKVYPKAKKIRQEIRSLEKLEARDESKIGELKDKLKANYKVKQPQRVVVVVEEVLRIAKENNWSICRCHDFIYIFNGAYWGVLDVDPLKTFLGRAAAKLGVFTIEAKYFQFREQLYRQFLCISVISEPERENISLVNFLNGTYVIGDNGNEFRAFKQDDFLKYQLPFDFDVNATAIKFFTFLDEVLPDPDKQKVLAEFLAYTFTHNLKLEKALLLYGTGANGKSVIFEIVQALFGKSNVSNYSLQSLTNTNGYYRAMLPNKLVNYSSEISSKMGSFDNFKKLASGEPIEARLPYGRPFEIQKYGRFIFNCNELPADVEQTPAFFRRLIIMRFGVTIEEEKQDKELANKIISDELPGIFNWVLEGLERLRTNKKFTSCKAIEEEIDLYKKHSDNVQLFLEDKFYKKSISEYVKMKDLHKEYKLFCLEDGYHAVSKKNFRRRLENIKVLVKKINVGIVAYLEKDDLPM